MKKTRSLMLFITVVACSFAGYFLYLNNKYWKNVRNSEKIVIGMSTREVVEVMGPPEKVLKSYFAESDSVYFYHPPFLASNGIEIFFRRGRVNKMLNYEGT